MIRSLLFSLSERDPEFSISPRNEPIQTEVSSNPEIRRRFRIYFSIKRRLFFRNFRSELKRSSASVYLFGKWHLHFSIFQLTEPGPSSPVKLENRSSGRLDIRAPETEKEEERGFRRFEVVWVSGYGTVFASCWWNRAGAKKLLISIMIWGRCFNLFSAQGVLISISSERRFKYLFRTFLSSKRFI